MAAILASTGTDRDVKIWDAETWPATACAVAGRATGRRRSLSARDGRQLAVGRYDGSVSIYDTVSGRSVPRTAGQRQGGTTMRTARR